MNTFPSIPNITKLVLDILCRCIVLKSTVVLNSLRRMKPQPEIMTLQIAEGRLVLQQIHTLEEVSCHRTQFLFGIGNWNECGGSIPLPRVEKSESRVIDPVV